MTLKPWEFEGREKEKGKGAGGAVGENIAQHKSIHISLI